MGDELIEITSENEDEHERCRVVEELGGKRWCIGYHCRVCGEATDMYGHGALQHRPPPPPHLPEAWHERTP